MSFLETMKKDVVALLPRALGSFIYQNRYDFSRGMTFMIRDIMSSPGKIKDVEEVRREAFARLNRDVPYCVEAFKGGEIKLDTSASNLAGRLGMIAYSIALVKMPAMPDLEYLEIFCRNFEESVSEGLFDIWVYYDGYGDFHCLGELMERLREEGMPEFRHVRNDRYPVPMREDAFAMFRSPPKFNKKMIFTDVDFNEIYSNMINNILDAYVYIWKCSGMDLAHPSYAAPPGTVVSRLSRRRTVTGGVLTSTALKRASQAAARSAEKEAGEMLEETPETPEEMPPSPSPRQSTPPPPPVRR